MVLVVFFYVVLVLFDGYLVVKKIKQYKMPWYSGFCITFYFPETVFQ